MKTWDDWSDKEVSDSVAKIYSNSYLTRDYCSSWADMGPLIVAEKIALYPNKREEWCADCYYKSIDIGHTHKNPLRAAAIVFLMMKGVKPCSQS